MSIMNEKNSLAAGDLPSVFPANDMAEQETIISWNRGDEYLSIYTTDNTMLTKLRKLLEAGEDGSESNYSLEKVTVDVDGMPYAVDVKAPLRVLSLRSGNKKEMTDEQKAALAERMAQVNANKKK